MILLFQYAETIGAFNAGFDTVNLHRPTMLPNKKRSTTPTPAVAITAAGCTSVTKHTRSTPDPANAMLRISSDHRLVPDRCFARHVIQRIHNL